MLCRVFLSQLWFPMPIVGLSQFVCLVALCLCLKLTSRVLPCKVRVVSSGGNVCSLCSSLSVHLSHLGLARGVSLLATKECLAVLVETQVGDHDIGGVDWELGLLAVDLLFDDFLNVDAPSATVDLGHLAFATLVGSAHHFDGVSVAHRDASSLVLLNQFLAQVTRHQLAADGGWRAEIRLS